MANTFGGFIHTSPLSSLPHDPHLTLASNCIRDVFGPVVQTVYDALQKCGGSASLVHLMRDVRSQCRRVWNEERERLVLRGKYKLQRARGPASSGFVVEASSIRAGLLVLLQHDIVAASRAGGSVIYTVNPKRARLITRYPRFVEYAKKALDETAAALVETLVVNGKMGTVDAVISTVNNTQDAPKSDKYTQRQAIVETFRRLVENGFVLKVTPLDLRNSGRKTVKIAPDEANPINAAEDPAIVKLLSNAPYKNILPRNAVWQINVDMFHQSIRAFCLGRLVAERYGHRVQSAGSMVTAALKLQASKKHVHKQTDIDTRDTFTPKEALPFLPKPVLQALEKKPGGLVASFSRSLLELCKYESPMSVSEIEEAQGHPEGGKFQVSTIQLVQYLRQRTVHQIVNDTHGEVAARICSILRVRGHLESDAIAEAAMMPAKDTREV